MRAVRVKICGLVCFTFLAPCLISAAEKTPPVKPAKQKSVDVEAIYKSLVALTTEEKPEFLRFKEGYEALQMQRLFVPIPVSPVTKKAGRKKKKRNRRGKKVAPLDAAEQDALRAWFKAKPSFKEMFLLALEPKVDNYAAAARLALKFKKLFPEHVDEFESLVVAFATVWDNPRVVEKMSRRCVPELRRMKLALLPEVSFGWIIKNHQKMCPGFKTIPWRLLTYLAADPTSIVERDWCRKQYAFRPDLGKVYSEIVYDDSKLVDNVGKLGANPYSLENLKTFGGVCRDQAYYARAVCRAFGMPSYIATGTANSAGGHAWVGWIVKGPKGFVLRSHGRYSYDKYFTAKIVDPKSGRSIYDYLVAIEAKALSEVKAYDEAEVYYRVWAELGDRVKGKPKADLLVRAVQKNAYHRLAWRAIGESVANGEMPEDTARNQWGYLLNKFNAYPDFVFAILGSFSKMFKTAEKRFRFYEITCRQFVGWKRQDLVAKLRLAQMKMCIAENRKDLAAQTALIGLQECAGEGSRGSELAKHAVELLRELKRERMAIKPLTFALRKMVRVRAGSLNPNWVRMTVLLRDIYSSTGDQKNAKRLQTDLDRMKR